VKKYLPTEGDFSGTLFPVAGIPEGSLATANFGSDALLFPATDPVDTSWFHINYASTSVAPADESFTIAYDANALTAYNATADPSQQYSKFPDSIYSFTTSQVTVKAGQNYSAAIPLAVYPDKIDLTKNYMLPISITSVPNGITLSGNFKTIYFHLIGNLIAGNYNQEWIRYNSATTTGVPYADQFFGGVFAPLSATSISAASGTGVNYILSFLNGNAPGGKDLSLLTNFKVTLDPASVTSAGITITGGPTIITADPVAHTYEFTFSYNNSLGAARVIFDKFSQ
jgi:hypothetical protein